jgi:hypothetical protein
LAEVYTPTNEELAFVQTFMRNPSKQLGFFILLKTFQRLGYFTTVCSVPKKIINYIAQCLGQSCDIAVLEDYDKSRVKWDHMQKIREFLQIKSFSDESRGILKDALDESAKTKEDIVDIINAGIEEMIRNRCELPTFDTLVREAKKARANNNSKIYSRVYNNIGQEDLKLIDQLLHSESQTAKSAWNLLREDTGKPTLKTARDLLNRLTWLLQFKFHGLDRVLDDIPYLKFHHLAMEARSLDAARVRSMTDKKKCTIVAALIKYSTYRIVDDLCEIMIKRMGKINRQAKDDLQEYLEKNREKQDEIIFRYKDIYDKCTSEKTETEILSSIKDIFKKRPDLVEYSNRHFESSDKNHFRFLWKNFKSSRAVFFDILSDLKFVPTSKDRAIEHAIEFALYHRKKRIDFIPLSTDKKYKGPLLPNMNDLSWIPDKWWSFVTGQKRRNQLPKVINRRNFEVCLFSQIVLNLKSADLCVEDSEQYADYRNRLVSWDEYNSNIVKYGEMVGLPIKKEEFTLNLKKILSKEATETDNTYSENQEFNIDEKGVPSLKRLRAVDDPEGLKTLEAQLLQRFKQRNILDILLDTQNILN